MIKVIWNASSSVNFFKWFDTLDAATVFAASKPSAKIVQY